MKIALIIEHFDPTRGGAEHLTVWLAGELAKAGHEVHAVCHDATPRVNRYRAATQGASHDADASARVHAAKIKLPDGVSVHTLHGFKLSTGFGFRLFGQRAAAWCRRNQPDVVHSMTVATPGDIYQPHAGVYAAIQDQAIASRHSTHEALLKKWLLKLSHKQRTLLNLEKKMALPPDAGGPWKILAISELIREEFAHYYGLPDERLFRLDNPRTNHVPEPAAAAEHRAFFRAHYGLTPEDRVAVFVGHDFRRKGLRWAIEAVAETKSNWKLLVVGLGKVREYFEMVHARGLQDRVKFVGPTQQVSQLYCAADALILPTFYDSFGLVVIEALAHGLPVVSTRRLGCAQVVLQHQVGTIVNDPRDVPAMAAALDALPAAAAEKEALAARCRAAAQGMPGDVYVQRLLALYAECVAAKQNRG